MKTEAEWKSDEQKLEDLKEWRKELRADLVETSRKIHILSTSINQYKKKEELKCTNGSL